LVIISKNPIISVLFLIGLFLSISTYLILLGINFIGLSYLLVYVGAVSILFLFILMLINIRISELISNTSNSVPLAIIISILFNYSINIILPYNISKDDNEIINLNDLNRYPNNNDYNYFLNEKDNFTFNDLNNNDIVFVTSKI
jgi:NADH-ubiquinone oxidoreductase chain 6